MSELFTVSPSSNVGSVFLTEFTFSVITSSIATSYAWDFGDGNYSYSGPVVSHIYSYPGTYTASGSAWTDSGTISSYQVSLSSDYVYANKVTFSQVPTRYSDPGEKTKTPFVVSVTSTEIEDSLYLTLQALNTNSIPFTEVPPKWEFITPTWKFIDADTNEVVTDGILVKTAPIYQVYNGVSRVVAVTGEASFYYIDNISTKYENTSSCPPLLIATLSTANFVYPPDSPIYPYNSYSNSEAAKAAIVWQINDYFPTNLKVTENFINDIYPIKWTNTPIPSMITCQFDSRLNSNFTETELITANLLGYPRTNDIGNTFPVNIELSNDQTYTLETSDGLYFSATDSNNNVNSGYIFTSITPLLSSVDPVTIIVSTSCVETLAVPTSGQFVFPNGYPIYSNAYIWKPYNSLLNKISYANYSATNRYVKYYRDLGVLTDGNLNILSLSGSVTTETETAQISSSAYTFGASFDPLSDRLYVCDPETQYISTFQKDGILNPDLSFNLTYSNGGSLARPCCMSVDGNHNIWVSLYNSEEIFKLDSVMNIVGTATPSTYNSSVELIGSSSVETDKENNVWSCYAETSGGRIVKFNENGNELINISQPLSSSVPVSLAIDIHNNVWVACYNSNMVLKLSSDGTVLYTLSGGFTRPNHLAVDRANNIWFTNGYNFISNFNVGTSTLKTWQILTNSLSSFLTTEFEQTEPAENEMWGGLAIDVYDRVWAIDSKTSNVVVFNAQDPTSLRVISTQPTLSTVEISLSIPVTGFDIPTSHIHSSQCVGDWTGNKWYQKYAAAVYTSSVSGVSTPFNVFDLDNSYNVAKVNESFDISSYFKSLALPESLSNNTLFFEEFLAAVAGDGNPTVESAGRVIYERIANFVQTHGDFETAEIDQLLSYAKQLSVDTKTFGTDFPAEITRLLNLFSVPKNQLRGRPNYDANSQNNVGELLTDTEEISAGQYLFARNKNYNTYHLVYATPLSDGTEIYPLSSISVAGFKTPITDNYYFFRYIQTNLGYTENVIDWNSIYTTFDYTLSTNEEWYGDNGLIETMFNNILTKRLIE
jgi:sugar lactone lactonase YvrE